MDCIYRPGFLEQSYSSSAGLSFLTSNVETTVQTSEVDGKD